MRGYRRSALVLPFILLISGWTWPWGEPELSSVDECVQQLAQPATGAAQRKGLVAACRWAHNESASTDQREFARCLLRNLPAASAQSDGRRLVNDCALKTKPAGTLAQAIATNIFPTVEEIAEKARQEAAEAREEAMRQREESARNRENERRNRTPAVGGGNDGPVMMMINGNLVLCIRMGVKLDCN